jgi:zinc protease
LIVAGDVDPDSLVAMLERIIGSWRTAAPPLTRFPEPKPARQGNVIYLVDKPGAVQSVFRVGRRWVGCNDPSFYPGEIGNHVFGVDFLSRLNKNLREKNGYSYGAGSRFAFRRVDGVWVSSSSVRVEATAPALKEMLFELDAVSGKNPLTPTEIELGRNALRRSFPESFEDPHSSASILASMASYGLPEDYIEAFLPRILATPTTDVRRVLAELASKEQRIILVVGDRKVIEPGLKALGVGEVWEINADGKPLAP